MKNFIKTLLGIIIFFCSLPINAYYPELMFYSTGVGMVGLFYFAYYFNKI